MPEANYPRKPRQDKPHWKRLPRSGKSEPERRALAVERELSKARFECRKRERFVEQLEDVMRDAPSGELATRVVEECEKINALKNRMRHLADVKQDADDGWLEFEARKAARNGLGDAD